MKGGATRSLSLPLPLGAPELRRTRDEVIREIDRLLDTHSEMEIAPILNQLHLRSGSGQPFTPMSVHKLRRHRGIRSRLQRLRAKGLLTVEEIPKRLNIAPSVVKEWRDKGLLRAHRYNDKAQCLYESPDDDLLGKFKKKRLYLDAKATILESAKGVQCEA